MRRPGLCTAVNVTWCSEFTVSIFFVNVQRIHCQRHLVQLVHQRWQRARTAPESCSSSLYV
jgi:hypothetical protein